MVTRGPKRRPTVCASSSGDSSTDRLEAAGGACERQFTVNEARVAKTRPSEWGGARAHEARCCATERCSLACMDGAMGPEDAHGRCVQ
jgi:hypothetical protein